MINFLKSKKVMNILILLGILAIFLPKNEMKILGAISLGIVGILAWI